MNQAHEFLKGKFREMWFGRHKRAPMELLEIGEKFDTWLRVIAPTL